MHAPREAAVAALVMAGGASARMRASNGPLHKALVPVNGVPLVERNVTALLARGFRRIVVAVAAGEGTLARWVRRRGAELAASCGARLELLVEPRPLGTAGAAGAAIGDAAALLVVNVDNLTSLDLQALVAFHLRSRARMTIATHREGFSVPYGELRIDRSGVRAYREKPVKRLWISSGTYVLDAALCRAIPRDRATHVPALVGELLQRGERVAAYRHGAAWIDVNHAAALRDAEELVAAHPRQLECLPRDPDDELCALASVRPDGRILLERGGPGWRVPCAARLRRRSSTVARLLLALPSRCCSGAPRLLCTFDHVGGPQGRITRYHVFGCRGGVWRAGAAWDRQWQWRALGRVRSVAPAGSVLARVVAAVEGARCRGVFAS